MNIAITFLLAIAILISVPQIQNFSLDNPNARDPEPIARQESDWTPKLQWSQKIPTLRWAKFVGENEILCTFKTGELYSYSVLDSRTGETLWTNWLELGCQGFGVKIKSLGEEIFVSARGEGTLLVVKIGNGEIMDEINFIPDVSSYLFHQEKFFYVNSKHQLMQRQNEVSKILFDVNEIESLDVDSLKVRVVTATGDFLFFTVNSMLYKYDLEAAESESLGCNFSTYSRVTHSGNKQYAIVERIIEGEKNRWSVVELERDGKVNYWKCDAAIVRGPYLFIARKNLVIHAPENGKSKPSPIHCETLDGRLLQELRWSQDGLYGIQTNPCQTQILAYNRLRELAVWNLCSEEE